MMARVGSFDAYRAGVRDRETTVVRAKNMGLGKEEEKEDEKEKKKIGKKKKKVEG